MKKLQEKALEVSLQIAIDGDFHQFRFSNEPIGLQPARRRGAKSDLQRLAWAVARSGILERADGTQPTHLEIYEALGSAFNTDLTTTDQALSKEFDRGTDLRSQIRFVGQLVELIRDESILHTTHASTYKPK